MENIPVDKRNRLNDQYVKYLFANEENKEFAISLINSVVEREGLETIKDLNFIGTELNSKNIDDKWCRLDSHAKTSDGTRINIEIQNKKFEGMVKRTVYYIFKEQILSVGQNYNDLKRHISISLARFYMPEFEYTSDFLNCCMFCNTKNQKHIFPDLIDAHYIEILKWERNRPKFKDMNMLDKWLAYLSDRTTEEERYILIKGDKIMSLVAAAENKFFSDEKQILAYLSAEKAEKDAEAALDFATNAGRDQGRQEMIISMIRENIPTPSIARVSGLSEERINEIKATLQ